MPGSAEEQEGAKTQEDDRVEETSETQENSEGQESAGTDTGIPITLLFPDSCPLS